MPGYDDIFEQFTQDLPALEKRIFEALKRNPQGLRRGQLVAIGFGQSVKAGDTQNNSTKDRKVRMAIRSLRMRMVPIVSSSGGAGYRLDVSNEGRGRMLADLISRRNELNELIERTAKFYHVQEQMPARDLTIQERLI